MCDDDCTLEWGHLSSYGAAQAAPARINIENIFFFFFFKQKNKLILPCSFLSFYISPPSLSLSLVHALLKFLLRSGSWHNSRWVLKVGKGNRKKGTWLQSQLFLYLLLSRKCSGRTQFLPPRPVVHHMWTKSVEWVIWLIRKASSMRPFAPSHHKRSVGLALSDRWPAWALISVNLLDKRWKFWGVFELDDEEGE